MRKFSGCIESCKNAICGREEGGKGKREGEEGERKRGGGGGGGRGGRCKESNQKLYHQLCTINTW